MTIAYFHFTILYLFLPAVFLSNVNLFPLRYVCDVIRVFVSLHHGLCPLLCFPLLCFPLSLFLSLSLSPPPTLVWSSNKGVSTREVATLASSVYSVHRGGDLCICVCPTCVCVSPSSAGQTIEYALNKRGHVTLYRGACDPLLGGM